VTSTIAAYDDPGKPVDVVAQFPHPTEIALGDGMADQRRGARLSAIGQQRQRLHLELTRSELGKRRDVTSGPEPESEVLPHHDPSRV
jgi:hypothetical protein